MTQARCWGEAGEELHRGHLGKCEGSVQAPYWVRRASLCLLCREETVGDCGGQCRSKDQGVADAWPQEAGTSDCILETFWQGLLMDEMRRERKQGVKVVPGFLV